MKQPAFDGEFGILLAVLAVSITMIIYGISNMMAKKRWQKMEKEVAAFNKLPMEKKLIRSTILEDDEHRVGFKYKYVDFYMRMHDTPEMNVYRFKMPLFESMVPIYMEILIMDEHKIAITASKTFVFYYINSSWEESMLYFFRCYHQCLAYCRLCDTWDTTHFYAKHSHFAESPDFAASIRRQALELKFRAPMQF